MTDMLKLLSNTADGVFAIDSECRFILWSKAAQEILGFTPNEVLGKFCYEVIPGKDPAGNLFCFSGCSVVTMAKKGCLVKNYDIQMSTKAGHQIWLNVSILLVPSPKLKGPVIVHLFRPIPCPGKAENREIIEDFTSRVLTTLGITGQKSSPHPASSPTQISSLTTREIEILRLIAQCLASKDIADKLCISHRTVRTHIQNILEKLQVHSKLEAVALAFQQNFFPSYPAEHPRPSTKSSTSIA
jgi:PAS domain S-box-containing protein